MTPNKSRQCASKARDAAKLGPCLKRYNLNIIKAQNMKLTHTLIIFLALQLVGCTAGPTVKSFTGPTGEKMSTVRCTKDTSPCFEKASEACDGGSYRVTSSYRNSGGLLADALPGPVTWYTMNVVCGTADGVMPTFPLRGSEPAMPTTPHIEKTQCTKTGNTVNCTSY
jgi:hypothetical protein